jgi:outer membrane protein assembly factor BamE (lipoprotein component of BamABCDE complex)
MFELSDHHLLQEGVTTKDRALRIMGSPSFVSDLDGDEAWVYYEEEVKRTLFFLPDITQRTALVLRFDAHENLRELQNITLASEDEKLHFEQKFTAVDSHKQGFFKSLFGNVGQVRPQ